MNFKDQRVLVIAPHPDDEIFGCGGLIHRVKREGGSVYILYLTVGTTKDFSKKGFSTQRERIREMGKVARFMEFDGWRIAFPGDKYHLKLDTVPQRMLVHEIEQGKGISLEVLKPSIIVGPSIHDYNQDHRAAAEAMITATRPADKMFKSSPRTVMTYEYPYSMWGSGESLPVPNIWVELKRADMAAKIKALSLYKSQQKSRKGPLSPLAVRTLSVRRGLESSFSFAEAFFLKRFLI